MRIPGQKLSIRTFLICLAFPVVACAIAFFVCYGRNIAWTIQHVSQKRHAPLLAVSLNPAPQDEEFSQCDFLNVTLDIPASMARNATIVKGADGTRWLMFADQIRKIRIPLTSSRAQRTAYGLVPPSVSKGTNTELLSYVYKKGSSDFSLWMNKNQLQEHDWAMSCRDLFGYDLHLKDMTYTSRGDFQLLVLSVASRPSTRRSSGWLAYANWSLSDNTDGGMVYFFDDAVGDSDWACRSASSLRSPDSPLIKNDDEFESMVANSTDDELLQMLKISEANSPR